MKSIKILLISITLGAAMAFSACSASKIQNTQSSSSSESTQNSSQSSSSESTQKSSQSASSGSTQTSVVTYKDGTYEGSARGYHPGLTVSVTVSGGKIASIEITSHNETPGFYEKAFNSVPDEIIDSQSTSVDTVSGATRSSVGIINAVANALKNAES